MQSDSLDAIVLHLSHFSVGLAERVEGAGSRVLGSGVFASFEGRCGLLTCGHVAEVYDKRDEIGLVRLVERTSQSRLLNLGQTQTIIVESGDEWSRDGFDLAYSYFLSDTASSIAAQSTFLNLEKNRAKYEQDLAGAPANTKVLDAVFGLVAELSQTPFVENHRFISPMRAMLYTGRICDQQNGLLTFDALQDDVSTLPKKFGGLSGGGLWRLFLDTTGAVPKIFDAVLMGLASYQIDDRQIACQGWDRIEQALLPEIHKNIRT